MKDLIGKTWSGEIRLRTLCALFLCLLVLCGTFHPALSLLAFFCAGVGVLCLPERDGFLLLVLLFPMAAVFRLSPEGQSFFTVLEFFYILVCFLRRGAAVRRIDMRILLFGGFLAAGQFLHGGFNGAATAKMLAALFLIRIARRTLRDGGLAPFARVYATGVLTASLAAIPLVSPFPTARFLTEQTVQIGGLRITRFSGLYQDPNYYAVGLIVALTMLAVLRAKRGRGDLPFLLSSLPFVFFALLTVSKSAFLMLLLPALLWLFILARDGRGTRLALGLLFCAGILLLFAGGGIFPRGAALDRLRGAGDLNGLTSGRLGIWQNFLSYLAAHPAAALFGRSILHPTLDGRMPHSTVLDGLYQLGVVGFALWLLLAGHLLRPFPGFAGEKTGRRDPLNASVLLCAGILFLFLSELQFYDLPFHLTAAMLTLSEPIPPGRAPVRITVQRRTGP